MTILVLGNSNIFRRKVYFALKKLKLQSKSQVEEILIKILKLRKLHVL